MSCRKYRKECSGKVGVQFDNVKADIVSQATPISPKEIVWTISHYEFVLDTE